MHDSGRNSDLFAFLSTPPPSHCYRWEERCAWPVPVVYAQWTKREVVYFQRKYIIKEIPKYVMLTSKGE
jgi:hypothetical protein